MGDSFGVRALPNTMEVTFTGVLKSAGAGCTTGGGEGLGAIDCGTDTGAGLIVPPVMVTTPGRAVAPNRLELTGRGCAGGAGGGAAITPAGAVTGAGFAGGGSAFTTAGAITGGVVVLVFSGRAWTLSTSRGW